MKKHLILLGILFLCNSVLAAPSNTMSIVPVAVDGTTITSSDENSRNNVVTTTFNAHDHTDISQTANTLNVGDALAGNKTITANNADSNKPFLRFDDTNNYWIVSTNGVAPSAVLQGTGITFEGTTDNDFETTLSITDPTADRTITIPNADGVVLPSGAIFFMITGSCPAGTTDVTSTYSNKFVRINATGGSTGGADTDSITLTTTELPAHTHNYSATPTSASSTSFATQGNSGEGATTIATSSTGSGTAFSVDTVPAYVTAKCCQVN